MRRWFVHPAVPCELRVSRADLPFDLAADGGTSIPTGSRSKPASEPKRKTGGASRRSKTRSTAAEGQMSRYKSRGGRRRTR